MSPAQDDPSHPLDKSEEDRRDDSDKLAQISILIEKIIDNVDSPSDKLLKLLANIESLVRQWRDNDIKKEK